ncbi:MAG: hypothetical protein WC712_14135, partial [Candidatus Brocadiia bacterium]
MPHTFPEASSLFEPVLAAVRAGQSICASGIWANSAELLIALLGEKFPARPVVVLHHSVEEAERSSE